MSGLQGVWLGSVETSVWRWEQLISPLTHSIHLSQSSCFLGLSHVTALLITDSSSSEDVESTYSIGRGHAMRPDIELARQRLQTILYE
jgi:hypothetical protein